MRNCIVNLILFYWIQDVLLSNKIWVGNADFAYQLMKSNLTYMDMTSYLLELSHFLHTQLLSLWVIASLVVKAVYVLSSMLVNELDTTQLDWIGLSW